MSKNIDIEELITLNYEIEGLLYLALHRGSDTPDGVWHLIEEKVRCLNDAVITERDSDTEIEPSAEQSNLTHGEPVCPDSELPMVTEVIEEEAETSVVDDSAQSEVENKAEHTVSDDDGPIVQACESQEDAPVSQADEMSFENEQIDDPIVPDLKEEQGPVADYQSADDILVDTDELVENSDIPLDDEPEECLDETEEEPVMRLDEKLARDYSKNLRKAFSLNDKFRFRRELFSNSDTVMADTLNLVGAMSSYSEAEEYFYSDLQWDPEMPEVVDFMAIIKKHFS